MTRARALTVPVALALLLSALDTRAEGPRSAGELLEQALGELSRARFRQSVELLEQARRTAVEPSVAGKIELYLGVNLAVLGDPDGARRAFRAAVTHDPTLTLDPRRIKREVLQMLEEVRRELVGVLVVTPNLAGARVRIDQSVRGHGRVSATLPIGTHEVEVLSPDGRSRHRQRVVVPAGGTVRLRVTLGVPPSPRPRGRIGPWTWVAGSGALAALTVAVTLVAWAGVDYEAYWDSKTEAARGHELEQEIRAKSIGAYTLFGISGALAATTAVLYHRDRRRREPPRVQLTPHVGEPGVGLTARFW